MIERVCEEFGTPGVVLADAGYCSNTNLEYAAAIEAEAGEHTRVLIATGRMRHGEKTLPPAGPVPAEATLRERMKHRLTTTGGHAAYARRKAIVEPVFGQIHVRQGKHLLLRGLEQARHEWELIAGCHNLLKLFTARSTGALVKRQPVAPLREQRTQSPAQNPKRVDDAHPTAKPPGPSHRHLMPREVNPHQHDHAPNDY